MRHLVQACSAAGLFILAGCAGRIDYVPPRPPGLGANSVVIDQPRDAVWARLVPALSREFFVINTIERASGLINVSYSGDPSRYIDCGTVNSFVSNARGERNYSVAIASPHANYETMENGQLFAIEHRMRLEGRVNIVVEELSPRQTRVSANARYIATRNVRVVNMGAGAAHTSEATASFNTGGSAPFSSAPGSLQCATNGRMESELVRLAT
jgi:hypothetical protein